MGKLTCSCLNVQISVKSSNLTAVDPAVLGITSSDEFFSSAKIAEVQLSLEGMKFVHPYLVKTHPVCDWLVHQCRGCETSTHATHALQGSGKVLVNVRLVHEASSVEALRKCSDFSPLYGIVLPSRNDNQPVRSLGLQSGKYESLQKLLGSIQQQLNTFLVREEGAMEERIKQFMETERSAYAALQSKVRRDKNTMVNLVLASEQQEISESLSDAMTESPTSPRSPLSPGSSEDILTSEPELPPAAPKSRSPRGPHPRVSSSHGPARVSSSQPKRSSALSFGFDTHGGAGEHSAKKLPSLSERMKQGSRFSSQLQENKVSSSVTPAQRHDPDGDLDFDSAFQDETSRPFYNSDDELEDTDDSEPESRQMLSRNNINLFSTSVPISVPMWGRASSNTKSFADDYDDDDGSLPHDGASMAASIKALAQSVHGDGTEMFGELPRPRLNTNTFSTLS